MEIFNKFIESGKKVSIYVSLKLSVALYLLYLFFNEEELSIRIILLAGMFILLMAMAPVLLMYFLTKKQKEKQAK